MQSGYISKAEIAEEILTASFREEFFVWQFFLFSTSASPKIGVAASKLVPRKEKGFQNDFKST